jgi:hypothetical protein
LTAVDPDASLGDTTQDPERAVLVRLLVEAAKLEHCLLDAYLYAAASLKSTPQEFAALPDGRSNRRRAVQFERARLWKRLILEVSHEEMLHLHYVQTLLRSLGERPAFALPDRDPDTDEWVMADWHAMIGTEPVDDGTGVRIPVEGATIDNLRRFVLYEATDALQDMDPYGEEARALFRDLAELELELRFETMLHAMPDGPERDAYRERLVYLYRELSPTERPGEDRREPHLRTAADEAPETFAFRSIADFYNEQVLPRYRDAFDKGWVREADRQLVDELQDPDHAGEGFLPMQMVYRDKNFEHQAQQNVSQPLIGVRRVEDIIAEIVEEGEGATDFAASARALLARVERIGPRAYVETMLADMHRQDGDPPTPDWFDECQMVRSSHLYRFAVLLTGMEEEAALAAGAGTTFDPVRRPIELVQHPELGELAGAVTARFNACYLVLVAWLSRMYEIQDWMADKPRRLSIEMLASWPLMSMAIRPMLELASFLPIDRSELFRLEASALPADGSARELLSRWEGSERSEDLHTLVDRLALQTLTEVAAWAVASKPLVDAAEGLDDNTRTMMSARLEELGLLREFEKEFPYRNAGGYSDRSPDLTYTQLHPGGADFEETPTMSGTEPGTPLFERSLLLRVRFAGWGQVQLATDPDPTFDEVGVTGTHMLHAADGDRRFDRSLVWDVDADPSITIRRGPRDGLPRPGVQVVDTTICVAPAAAQGGYAPLEVLNSSGAVQTTGLQQDVDVTGVLDVLTLSPDTVGPASVTLHPKDGVRPFLNGLNHVVSQDGEAIDPFVLAVRTHTAGSRDTVLEREAYDGDGSAFLDMSPLQRLDTGRRPTGFDTVGNLPDWVRPVLPEDVRELASMADLPAAWLSRRAEVLGRDLGHHLDVTDAAWTQGSVDEAVSLAERLALINVPKGTTRAWLGVLLHYGHTVSGTIREDRGGPLLEAIHARTGIPLQVARAGRDAPNGRWLARYTMGVMDTDSLRNLVYGELLLPLSTHGTTKLVLRRSWDVRADMAATVAAVACRFDAPFWGDYQVHGATRTTTSASGATVTDHLTDQRPDGYRWTSDGVEGSTHLAASLHLEPNDTNAPTRRLTLAVTCATTTAEATVADIGIFAGIADAIPGAFARDVGLTPVD